MRLHRIYYPFSAQIGEKVIIDADRAHYIKNVLRLNVSRNLRIFNQHQQEFLAEVVEINKKHIQIMLIKNIECVSPSKLNISLVQSISKGERMDYTVQKATELGINRIIPITSEFCEVRLKGTRLEKRMAHWENIAISACEQSFRGDIPEILHPISINEYAQIPHQGIVLEPEEKQTISSIAKTQWQKFDVVVGPEGGWSQNDLKLLKSTGLSGMKFGQRVLRTETMAPAILAAIHSLWGDFV